MNETVNAVPKPAAPAVDTTHQAFLLFVGQVIGVFIAAWVAGVNENIGRVIVAIFVVLWLIWLMSRTDVLSAWGAKVGLPTGLTPQQATRGLK